jgi:DNA-binding transcriptional MerR regulator
VNEQERHQAPPDPGPGYLRIGELAKRTGVSPELLRAWEQRYGLLQPTRTAGGFRLYSAADEARVKSMQSLVSDGLAAAQAARLTLSGGEPAPRTVSASAAILGDEAGELAASLDRLDEQAANTALDGLFAAYTVETVLKDVVLPYLHRLGEQWEAGEVSVAQEHFASNLIRGRLLGLARGWAKAEVPAPFSPVRQVNSTNLACWPSGWRCAAAAGGSPISVPTARSVRSPTSPDPCGPRSSSS